MHSLINLFNQIKLTIHGNPSAALFLNYTVSKSGLLMVSLQRKEDMILSLMPTRVLELLPDLNQTFSESSVFYFMYMLCLCV